MPRWRRHLLIYCVLTLWTLFPLLGALVAAAVASAWGCTVEEGAVHPCHIFALDLGTLLYTLSMLGWLSLVTLPTGVLAVLLYTVYASVAWLLTLWRQRRLPPRPRG